MHMGIVNKPILYNIFLLVFCKHTFSYLGVPLWDETTGDCDKYCEFVLAEDDGLLLVFGFGALARIPGISFFSS
jgi:hypothetical protein